jgi:hypothetical protein
MHFDQRCQEMGAEIINTKTKNHLYGYDCITKTIGITNTIMDIIGLYIYIYIVDIIGLTFFSMFFTILWSWLFQCQGVKLQRWRASIQGPRWEVSSETTRCILTLVSLSIGIRKNMEKHNQHEGTLQFIIFITSLDMFTLLHLTCRDGTTMTMTWLYGIQRFTDVGPASDDSHAGICSV